MPRRSLPAVASVLVLLTGALSACGGSSSSTSSSSSSSSSHTASVAAQPSDNGVASRSPSEIVAAAKAAADAAQSVHLSGKIVSDGSPIVLDMQLLTGKGGRGRISENGLSFDLIQLGGTVYISGSPAFYRHVGGPAAAQLFQGKWLKASASSADFVSISSLTNLHKLLDTALVSHGALAKGEASTIGGQKVIGVKDTSEGGTLFVATTGTPYPIEVAKNGGSAGKIVFDRWNAPVALAAPANAVDIAQLRAGH